MSRRKKASIRIVELDEAAFERLWNEDYLNDTPPPCEHRAAYPMGPRFMYCIDCGKSWQAPKP